ncbi:uncharacterized protein [Nicotiana sylvestris]|uniref:uncharacterized protein n=1 Tax=Nicotiana sylvestris TaxID=4096 RepID=UPI00388CA90D
MDEEDAEKIAFITPYGVYCYKMMSFGLKNARATYMRAMTTIFLDMIHKEIEVAANFKGVGIGVVLVSDMGQHYLVSAKLKFPYTNKMAEYEACILGLNMVVNMNIQELLVIGDLDLLLHQVQGEWATKNSKILPYLYHVQELRKRSTKIEFRHVPIIQNVFADALASLSSIIQHLDRNFIDPIPVRIHNQPAYYAHVEEETDGKPWFHDIKEYLAKGEYPEHANHTQKRTLQRLSNLSSTVEEICIEEFPIWDC